MVKIVTEKRKLNFLPLFPFLSVVSQQCALIRPTHYGFDGLFTSHDEYFSIISLFGLSANGLLQVLLTTLNTSVCLIINRLGFSLV